jgi:hypothetical protein
MVSGNEVPTGIFTSKEEEEVEDGRKLNIMWNFLT